MFGYLSGQAFFKGCKPVAENLGHKDRQLYIILIPYGKYNHCKLKLSPSLIAGWP